MDSNRYFSVPYDAIHDFKIRRLMKASGGIVAYGRWVALLGMLYDEHGLLDMNDQLTRDVVAQELELEDVDEFMMCLAHVGLIDSELYHATSHVVNSGVCEELEYFRQKSESGKKGGRPRKKQPEKQNEKQSKKQVL